MATAVDAGARTPLHVAYDLVASKLCQSGKGVCMTSFVLNGIIVALTFMAWVMLLSGVGSDSLDGVDAPRSLRRFAVLSNLFSAVVAVLYLVWTLDNAGVPPAWLLALKLSASASLLLTLAASLTILVPLVGWRHLFVGGNLLTRLVLPLLACADCVMFVPVGQLPLPVTLVSAVPCALYAIWYMGWIMRHRGERDLSRYDIYLLLRWGRAKAPVVAGAIVLASWLLGLVIWSLSGLFAMR